MALLQYSSESATMSTQPSNTPVEAVKDTIDDMLLLSALREEGKAELLDILESMRGRKCLVMDPQLSGLLNQIIVEGSQILKDNDVEYLRELKDEGLGDFHAVPPAGGGAKSGHQNAGDNVPENIVYLVRPQLPLMSLIANQIKLATRNGRHFDCGTVVRSALFIDYIFMS